MKAFSTTWLSRALTLPFAGVVLLGAHEARAGIDACGNIDVQANVNCTLDTSGGCTARCTPVNFELACAGKLQAQCEGGCTLTLPSCQASCEADCNTSCTVNPPALDCSANCQASCDADCTSTCATRGNTTQCMASCKASCGGHCDASCTGTPGSASCQGKCTASCQGSCSGQANLGCEVDCQANLAVQCKADLSGGCNVQCTQPSGALFCDGQFVDTGNNAQQCLDAVEDYIKTHFTASASGSCSGNECQAEASVGTTCDVAGGVGANGTSGGLLLAGVGIVGLTVARRRRQG